jgi:hypothetical protein
MAVFLHDAENNVMNLHLIEKFFDGPTPKASLATERSPAGRCFLAQEPLIIPDIDTETRFGPEVIEIFKRFDVKSCYQPLTTSVRRLGALSFGRVQPGRLWEPEMPDHS